MRKPFLQAMNFQPIHLKDLPVFQRFLSAANKQCCDYALANLYAWSAYYRTEWAESGGFLVIRFHIAGSEKWAYLEPLGSGNFENAFENIRKAANESGQPVRFFSLSENFTESLRNSPLTGSLHFYKDRNFGNYIYTRERLASLAGRKLHSKRNHIATFNRRYPNYQWKILSPESDLPLLRQLLDSWISSQESATTTILEERQMIETSLAHYRELNLFGILLSVNGEPIAFSYGSKVRSDTFCTHVEKANTRYEGAYAKINQLMAEALPESIRFINREEDMGIPELRKSKLSYLPETISEEFFAYDADSEEGKIWALWQKSFPNDDDSFLTSFIYPYSNESNRMTLYENERLASMLHLFEFSGDWGRTAYIYGLATDPDFRHKGYASSLISKALIRAFQRKDLAVWAIPENKEFKCWQERLEFSNFQTEPLHFLTDDGFSFGENPATDMGIFRIIDMEAYLNLFAKENSSVEEVIPVFDKLLPSNSGTFRIFEGKAHKISAEFVNENRFSPAEIANRYTLRGGKRLKFENALP